MQSPGQATFSTEMVAEMGWARSTDILSIPSYWQSVPPKRKETITSSLVAQQKQNKN